MTRQIRRIGDNEFELGPHMNTLPQEFIDVLSRSTDDRIFSCGIDENSLYFVTNKSYVGVVTSNGRMLPTSAIPSHDGRKVHIIFKGSTDSDEILTSLLVSASKNALGKGTLSIGDRYICEIDTGADQDEDREVLRPETIHQRGT